jgi:hypothetical protein
MKKSEVKSSCDTISLNLDYLGLRLFIEAFVE